MMCRYVRGEGPGLRSGETEESGWTAVPHSAGEVFSNPLCIHITYKIKHTSALTYQNMKQHVQQSPLMSS